MTVSLLKKEKKNPFLIHNVSCMRGSIYVILNVYQNQQRQKIILKIDNETFIKLHESFSNCVLTRIIF